MLTTLFIFLLVVNTIFAENKILCGQARLIDEAVKDKIITRGVHRVVGGNESVPHRWPWTVQLIYTENNVHRCGAAIIGDSVIATAAHCFSRSRNPQRYTVLVGGHEIGAGERNPVRNISIHPLFNFLMPSTFDVAIARLYNKIKFRPEAQPICLPSRDPTPLDQCFVAGWGYQNENGKFSAKLRDINVPIVPVTRCNDPKHYSGRVDALTMICAGIGGADACQGDSGGPLMCFDSVRQRWELHGVVSWGHGCGRNTSPGVYSKIHAVKAWIIAAAEAMKLNDDDFVPSSPQAPTVYV